MDFPFPSSGNLPKPGIERRSPALQADSLPYEPPGKPTLYESPLLNAASVSVYILTTDLEVKAYYEIQELSSIVILQAFN